MLRSMLDRDQNIGKLFKTKNQRQFEDLIKKKRERENVNGKQKMKQKEHQ